MTVEPFLELALDIVPESVFSVADALTRMTNSETLHGAHKAARAAQGWGEGQVLRGASAMRSRA